MPKDIVMFGSLWLTFHSLPHKNLWRVLWIEKPLASQDMPLSDLSKYMNGKILI